jgi:hypothetical protein
MSMKMLFIGINEEQKNGGRILFEVYILYRGGEELLL